MSRLTILSLNSSDAGGGAERVGRELHEHYAAAGEDAWLAVGRKRGGDPRTVEIPNRARRSPWARVWMRAADALPPSGAGFRAARALREAVAEPARWAARLRGREDFNFPGTAALLELPGRTPDALHLHNLHGGYFDLRALPALTARVPAVLSLHDAWLLSGHCAHSFDCGRWETGCGECPALWIYPAVPRDATAFNWARKRALFAQSAVHVGVPCEWLAARVRRSMLMPAVRELRVIPFGVDLDVFRAADRAERAAARAALGLDPSRAVFLVFANALRARTWKDSFAFRGALERLRGSAASAQWVALGETGPDEQVGGVRVRFAGFETDDRRLARWYQAADAYVHPSRADTFPQMVVESLACGTPVIATDVGGIPEQIASASFLRGARASARVDTATGALVPAGDAGALAHAIAAVAELDAERRAALSANAARDARARFDRRAHAREYLDWIRSVAAARADASGSATPGAARGSR
ncbi:MAG TPA: glycosyltransferase [Gemmatimonadaceae bacterium]|nr:glycosyltransferase [Gemmatimonadaceae bacterium]